MNVLIFKTNMIGAGCKRTAGVALQGLESDIQWTVDLDDCDKVLRVETAGVTATTIEQTMRRAGFTCEELQ